LGQPVEKTRPYDPNNNYLIVIQSVINPPYINSKLLPFECEERVENSSERAEIHYLGP
jgi:hypothetical protein